ncbi:MAG: NUDIX hydrolase [Acidobacteriota bacterium]
MAGTMLNEVPALPAASAIILRDDPFEVLMLRRPESASFVPNAWVFPGGMTEEVDRELTASALDAMKITAARETFEETGVWLGAPLGDAEESRARLSAGTLSLRELLAENPLDLDSLVYTAHWITPVGIPKRFDTYFFLATVTRDVVARAELREAAEVRWIHPAEALDRHAAKEMQMVFPTLRSLEALAGFDHARDLMESRRGATIEAILPVLVNGKPTLGR